MVLKTLKDFNVILIKDGDDMSPSQEIRKYNEDLRQEAIKWIKMFKRTAKECPKEKKYYGD